METESDFVTGEEIRREWSDVTLVEERSHSVLYRGKRYGRWFMLKTLREEHRGMTAYRLQQEKEFEIGVRVQHPYIAETYSLETVRGMMCIVQEFVEGERLDEWIRKGRPREERTRVLGQMLEALEYLHKEGIAHCDIKPQNIMVTHNGGNVRLVDFGLSETDDSATRKTCAREDMASVREVVRMIGVRPLPRDDESIEGYMRRLDRIRQIKNIVPYAGVVAMMVMCVVMAGMMNGRYEERTKQDAMKITILEDSAKTLRDRVEKQERQIEEQGRHIEEVESREREMVERVNKAFDIETATWRSQAARCGSFREITELISRLAEHAFVTRDKIVGEYGKNDPLRSRAFHLWVERQTELQSEIFTEARERNM